MSTCTELNKPTTRSKANGADSAAYQTEKEKAYETEKQKAIDTNKDSDEYKAKLQQAKEFADTENKVKTIKDATANSPEAKAAFSADYDKKNDPDGSKRAADPDGYDAKVRR